MITLSENPQMEDQSDSSFDHPATSCQAASCYRQVAHPAQSNASPEFVALDLGVLRGGEQSLELYQIEMVEICGNILEYIIHNHSYHNIKTIYDH